MSISNDWAVVGAWQDDDAGSTSGSAYVFRRNDYGTPGDPSDDTWVEHAKLTASDAAPYAQFGYSVAVNEEHIAVGSWKDAAGVGSAYVFRRDDAGTPDDLTDDVWSEEVKVGPDDTFWASDFGTSVALCGEHLVVGAYNYQFARGVAFVFRDEGSGWTQEAKLTASDRTNDDRLGFSVSISGDYALAGASGNDDAGSSSGSAYVFRRDNQGTPSDPSDDIWIEQAKLTASDAERVDLFGWSVSISGDLAAVGARGDDDAGRESGSAYVFERDDNGTPDNPTDDTWVEQAKLTASDGAAGDRFGHSVSISGDYVVVGANLGDAEGVPDSGAVYVFRREGNSWAEVAKLTASDTSFADGFGRSVSLNGDLALVGA